MYSQSEPFRQFDVPFALKGKRVWVAGHRGMVGSAIVRCLASDECEILTADRAALDLRRQADVESWMVASKPDAIFLAAATVGGILANDSRPAEFIYDNLAIEANIINAAKDVGVKKLLFLGSTCIYPKQAPQPIQETSLLTGPLESTNESYAIAKIAGIILCQAYRRQYDIDMISAMPTNLYGPGDNFDLKSSHVLPALIARFHRAKVLNHESVEIWGTGTPRREFLFAGDCADALVFLMKNYSGHSHVNVGVGKDLTILELANVIRRIVGFQGNILLDKSKPDGTPRKLVDTAILGSLGWDSSTKLSDGIRETYNWFLRNAAPDFDPPEFQS